MNSALGQSGKRAAAEALAPAHGWFGLGYLRQRIQQWIASRPRRQAGPVCIERKRIYIVPTRFGYGFGLLLLVMLLGAMNYSNSMAFAMTFLLAGMGLLGMHHTHANLLNLRVHRAATSPVFAGEEAQFAVLLENPSATARYAVSVGWPDAPPSAVVDVPAQGQTSAALPLASHRRGWLAAPRFAVATEFPLGLLHAWTWVELDAKTIVYPRPAPAPGNPPQAIGGQGHGLADMPGVEEFAGLKPYVPGDAAHSIHWKSFAKTGTPQVKRFADAQAEEQVLDFDATLGSLDERIARLTAWVLAAEAAHTPYRLRLPNADFGPAVGPAHAADCLAALALYGL